MFGASEPSELRMAESEIFVDLVCDDATLTVMRIITTRRKLVVGSKLRIKI
jgi:hypothetical protein